MQTFAEVRRQLSRLLLQVFVVQTEARDEFRFEKVCVVAPGYRESLDLRDRILDFTNQRLVVLILFLHLTLTPQMSALWAA